MIREIITKDFAIHELAQICWMLEEACQSTKDSSIRERLENIAEQANKTYKEFFHYYELTKIPRKDRRYRKYIRALTGNFCDKTEILVSLAFSRAGGMAGAETDGFEMHHEFREKIDSLSKVILKLLHEMRHHR